MFMQPVGGSLVFYDKAAIDPENPEASVVARAQLPPELRQAIVVVVPAPRPGRMLYRMVIIDDSDKAFPFGESEVLSFVGLEIGIHVGEHKLMVRPWKKGRVPHVKKANDYHMAQTNFHYKANDGSWVPFVERQLQYTNASRRIFIIHATPEALQPTVTTIVDTDLRPTTR